MKRSFMRKGDATLKADLAAIYEHRRAEGAAMVADIQARRAAHHEVTREHLIGAKYARVGGQWLRVVKVNRSTVSLVTDYNPSTGFELVTRFPFSQIREVK